MRVLQGCCLLAALALVGCGRAARSESASGPFPAQSLRVDQAAPDLNGLSDHHGAPVIGADLSGKVVLLTSIYACCPLACPVLLAETRLAVDALPPELRKDLVVLAVTMDPERDTPEKLADLAETFAAGPEWRFLTGSSARVNAVLDDMGVERQRNAETGEIDHNSVVLLLDRRGKLAYRLGKPDDAHRQWHVDAMSTLLREPR